MGQCTLCNIQTKFVDAHIIPKWAYRYLYPEDKEAKKKSLIFVSKEQPVKRPIGIYDSNILCAECDKILGKLDEYGKVVLLDKKFIKYKNTDYIYFLETVDVNKLKLFLLSILWRSSISKRKEFNRINIGPYEEKIRNILILQKENKTKQIIDYDFIITKFEDGDFPNINQKNIQIPRCEKIDSVNMGVIYFPRGIKVYVKVDQRPFPSNLQKVTAGSIKEGALVISMGRFQESNDFVSLLRTINNNKNHGSSTK